MHAGVPCREPLKSRVPGARISPGNQKSGLKAAATCTLPLRFGHISDLLILKVSDRPLPSEPGGGWAAEPVWVLQTAALQFSTSYSTAHVAPTAQQASHLGTPQRGVQDT